MDFSVQDVDMYDVLWLNVYDLICHGKYTQNNLPWEIYTEYLTREKEMVSR